MTHFPTQTIEVQGHSITYFQNCSTGKPVVFLHGNSLSSASFIKQFAASWAQGYRLIAFEMIGHGTSLPASDPDDIGTCTL